MKNILQFEPWPSCSISSLFWKTLAAKKLNEFLKGRIDIKINGFYLKNTTSKTPTSSLFLSTESFEINKSISSVAELGTNFVALLGKLVLCDTIEEFKALNRSAEASKVIEDNYKCSNLEDLEYFVILAFADVKRFKFYHQIVYPVHIFANEQITFEYVENYENTEILEIFRAPHYPFDININSKVIQFIDNSCVESVPGWPLRQLLVNLSYKCPGSEFKVHCKRSLNDSFILSVQLPKTFSSSGLTGWERLSTDPKTIAPIRITDISGLLDPVQLAKQAGELNLKLMKWRLVPDLDLESLSKTSCLLIGSGTLGCNVLRLLLGWGFRKITLVDNGKVSYSNPVRQSLFTFEDAKVGASKALTAASRALQIDPNAQIEGFDISVPMPGHPLLNDTEIESRNSYNNLNRLVKSHDVIFLLTDSRESRWLPALLGHRYEKIVITVGLGFDSYVVMRHGMRKSIDKSSCYFCHDIIGPIDSLTGRSLDQQCTVTRPGLSFIAAALAVELLVSLLQVSDLEVKDSDSKAIPANFQSRLGKIPHQIRGNLANQEMFTLTGSAFEHCTCCSKSILKEFENGDDFEFIKNVCNSPIELERISGLSEMKSMTQEVISLNVNDDEFVMSDNDF